MFVLSQMSIVFHEAGLKCVEIPCLAQSFVNHNARLFKIFVIGDRQFVVERPSIKNFHAGGRFLGVCFDKTGLFILSIS